VDVKELREIVDAGRKAFDLVSSPIQAMEQAARDLGFDPSHEDLSQWAVILHGEINLPRHLGYK